MVIGAAGISNLADAFASQIGTVQKAAAKGSAIPFYPPFQISKDKTYVDSCLGYIPVGKRETSPV